MFPRLRKTIKQMGSGRVQRQSQSRRRSQRGGAPAQQVNNNIGIFPEVLTKDEWHEILKDYMYFVLFAQNFKHDTKYDDTQDGTSGRSLFFNSMKQLVTADITPTINMESDVIIWELIVTQYTKLLQHINKIFEAVLNTIKTKLKITHPRKLFDESHTLKDEFTNNLDEYKECFTYVVKLLNWDIIDDKTINNYTIAHVEEEVSRGVSIISTFRTTSIVEIILNPSLIMNILLENLAKVIIIINNENNNVKQIYKNNPSLQQYIINSYLSFILNNANISYFSILSNNFDNIWGYLTNIIKSILSESIPSNSDVDNKALGILKTPHMETDMTIENIMTEFTKPDDNYRRPTSMLGETNLDKFNTIYGFKIQVKPAAATADIAAAPAAAPPADTINYLPTLKWLLPLLYLINTQYDKINTQFSEEEKQLKQVVNI